MGTRNLTLVKSKNEYKVAQYGQWDGYPKGQGIKILNILRALNLAEFQQKVDVLKEISEEQLEKLWKKCGADNSGFANMEVSEKFEKNYPHLHRDCGGEVLELIAFGKVKEVALDVEFAGDSLFCEWAYVIDFDKNTFEVYQGFSKQPLPDDARFKFLEEEGKEYKPVRIVAKWSLDNLPTEEDLINLQSEREEAEDQKVAAASGT